MFNAMFQTETRYFFVHVDGRLLQIFASVSSALRWLGGLGVSDTASIRFLRA